MDEDFDYQGKRPDQIEKSNKAIGYSFIVLLIAILIEIFTNFKW